MAFASELFLKTKDIVENTFCCEYIAGVVNIYLYWCVSPLDPECAICLCVS